MYGKVKRLRVRGKRLSDREIGASTAVEGALTLAMVGGALMLEVKPPDAQVGESLFPCLYDARLTTMHSGSMLFKGEERPQGDAGPSYVQEWSVRIEMR